MIYYGCPKCQGPMASPDGMVGQPETCPNCGNVTTVPAPAVQQPQQPSVEAPPIQPGPGAPAPVAYAQQAPADQPGKGAGYAALGLSIPGLAFGGLSLASAWATPCCCCVPLPIAALGLVLGVVGLVMGCVAKPRQVILPLAAVGVSILALAMYVYQTWAVVDQINTTVAKVSTTAQVARARLGMRRLEIALRRFRIDCGRYPTSDEGFDALIHEPADTPKWAGPYLNNLSALKDPWGRPYFYGYPPAHEGSDYDIYSLGPDGLVGTADDVGNWQPVHVPTTQLSGPTTSRPSGSTSDP